MDLEEEIDIEGDYEPDSLSDCKTSNSWREFIPHLEIGDVWCFEQCNVDSAESSVVCAPTEHLLPGTMEEALASVSTAQPTIPIAKPKKPRSRPVKTKCTSKTKPAMKASQNMPAKKKKKASAEKPIRPGKTRSVESLEIIKIQKDSESEENEIDIEDSDDSSNSNIVTSLRQGITDPAAPVPNSDHLTLPTCRKHIKSRDTAECSSLVHNQDDSSSQQSIAANFHNMEAGTMDEENQSSDLDNVFSGIESCQFCSINNCRTHCAGSVDAPCSNSKCKERDNVETSYCRKQPEVKNPTRLEHSERKDESCAIEQLDTSGLRSGSDDDDGESPVFDDSDNEHINEFPIVTSDGDVVYLPNPTEENIINWAAVTELERKIHAEFFDRRSVLKNEARYLKIKKYILDQWNKQKPLYVNKTSLRTGLKHCGDVNCIGRIHTYLEQTGAINFGCSEVQYNRPKVSQKLKMKKFPGDRAAVPARRDLLKSRKRRVRDQHGEWVEESELEGKTVEHDTAPATAKTHKSANKPNPFKLVPCQEFTEIEPAPFMVDITCSALVVMDVHSHICKTEVIGLLGGLYNKEDSRLYVTIAEPCESVSTGMQCEMDPVSQIQASEKISECGLQIVGWYHSHPTFAPIPSIRDLETQQDFQNWFALRQSPFVGVILSPYNRSNLSSLSQITCLTVQSEKQLTVDTGVPFKFDYGTSLREWDGDKLLARLESLLQDYSRSANRVETLNYLNSSQLTCLQKMQLSIARFLPEEEQQEIMGKISDIFYQTFSAINS